MADLTNAKIANTFKDLLQVNAATSNSGLDSTVRTIQDGGGTASPIAMSQAQLNVTGQFALPLQINLMILLLKAVSLLLVQKMILYFFYKAVHQFLLPLSVLK